MWLEIDANGINIRLRINGYKPASENNGYYGWCKCDFRFSSGFWLNYRGENKEILLAFEVENLEKALTELLDNKLLETKEIICMEPDFDFILHPQTDLRNSPKLISIRPGFIRPGNEIQDIYLVWNINFWNKGMTENRLSIVLYRDEIVIFRDYLSQVINRKSPI